MPRIFRQHLARLAAVRRAPADASADAGPATPTTPATTRRGSALMLVLVLTFAMGGLATSAIYLSSNTTILAKLYDRERDYRYAAEWALAVGKARITKDTLLVLPDSLSTQLMTAQAVTKAGGGTVPLARVDLYAGLSGAVSGQYGKAISLVAVVSDQSGARHARRLELAAENFARYAVFTDRWAGGCYTTGEIVRGRAHSNQAWNSCNNSPGPIYTDTVSAVTTVNGIGQYQLGNMPNAQRIPYPTVAKLANLPTLATGANLNIVGNAEASGGTRIEFVPVDINNDAQFSTDEGFFRVFFGNNLARTRADFPYTSNIQGNGANPVIAFQCGAFYTVSNSPAAGTRQVFLTVATHDSAWFVPYLSTAPTGTYTNAQATTFFNMTPEQILGQAGARCYPAGDPHLMPSERPTTYPSAARRRGGEDTTFTPTVSTGTWRTFPGSAIASIGPTRQDAERAYLWPIHRSRNPNSVGVIYIDTDVFVSGMLRGRVTLYSAKSVKFVDDLVYTVDPASLPICQNLLGIIAGDHEVLIDNIINRPRSLTGGTAKFFDDAPHFVLHGVTLAGVNNVDGSFVTENLSNGPNANQLCAVTGTTTAQTSGGCINQSGGVIEKIVSATFAGGWTGFAENRMKDACLDIDSPPYFPLTGRYADNEFYELDPVKMNANQATAVANLFRALQGATP